MSVKKHTAALELPRWLGVRSLSDLALHVDRPLLRQLALFDLILIAVHVVAGIVFERIPHLLNIALDFSLAEIYGYGKWAAIVALLLAAFRRTRRPILISMALIFTLMLLDDSLQLHERIGSNRVDALSLTGTEWLKAQDIGEVLVWALMAAFVLPVMAYGIMRSDAHGRRIGLRLMALIALFALFGGVVDMLHHPFRALPFGIQLADLLEDGGEMLVGSLILAHVAAMTRGLQLIDRG